MPAFVVEMLHISGHRVAHRFICPYVKPGQTAQLPTTHWSQRFGINADYLCGCAGDCGKGDLCIRRASL